MDDTEELKGVIRHQDGKLAIIIPRNDIRLDFAEFDVANCDLYLTIQGEKSPRRVGCYHGEHEQALRRVTSILVAHLTVDADGKFNETDAVEYDIPFARR